MTDGGVPVSALVTKLNTGVICGGEGQGLQRGNEMREKRRAVWVRVRGSSLHDCTCSYFVSVCAVTKYKWK